MYYVFYKREAFWPGFWAGWFPISLLFYSTFFKCPLFYHRFLWSLHIRRLIFFPPCIFPHLTSLPPDIQLSYPNAADRPISSDTSSWVWLRSRMWLWQHQLMPLLKKASLPFPSFLQDQKFHHTAHGETIQHPSAMLQSKCEMFCFNHLQNKRNTTVTGGIICVEIL